jgi:Zn-finger nucleic acid-binding protein
MADFEVTCPRCEVLMSKMDFLRTTIDICPNCNGCWLDQNEITQLTRSRGDRAVWLKLTDTKPCSLLCPRCKAKNMQVGRVEVATQAKSIEVDECKVCGGLWLDRGELAAVLAKK